MLSLNIENYITNTNFILLFTAMILYLLQSASLLSEKWRILMIANNSILLSSFLQALFLGVRWISSGHFPISNLYESLLFLSWVVTSFLVFLNIKTNESTFNKQYENLKNKKDFNLKISLKKLSLDSFLGTIITPLILLINTFATFSLPVELKINSSLVPALQSNWLLMHVTLMMLSYGSLLCGCLLAIAFLIVPFFSSTFPFTKSSQEKPKAFSTQISKIDYQMITPNSLDKTIQPSSQNQMDIEISQILDNLSYRFLSFGFPLLTIGILSGAVWANKSWGTYWSWDPKETWALITWFIFVIYLHTRISYGWKGRQSAFIASFGFVVIWICYLGVNLVGNGLHSYGFFT
jgi:cytochrome c-type biogenesis protein CcsB